MLDTTKPSAATSSSSPSSSTTATAAAAGPEEDDSAPLLQPPPTKTLAASTFCFPATGQLTSYTEGKPLSSYDKVRAQTRRLRECSSHVVTSFQRDCTIGKVPQNFVPVPPRYRIPSQVTVPTNTNTTTITTTTTTTTTTTQPSHHHSHSHSHSHTHTSKDKAKVSSKATRVFQEIKAVNTSIRAVSEEIARLERQKNDNFKQAGILEQQKSGIPAPSLAAVSLAEEGGALSSDVAAVRVIAENRMRLRKAPSAAESNGWRLCFTETYPAEAKQSREHRCCDVSSTAPYKDTLLSVQNSAHVVAGVVAQERAASNEDDRRVAAAYRKDMSAWWRRMAGEDSVSLTARANTFGPIEHGKCARKTRSGKVFSGDAVGSENELQDLMRMFAAQDSMTERDDIFIDMSEEFVCEAAPLPEMLRREVDPAARFRYVDRSGLVADPVAQDALLREKNPWRQEEKDLFVLLFSKFHKKFDKIAAKIPGKSTEDVINFFYRNKFALGLHGKSKKLVTAAAAATGSAGGGGSAIQHDSNQQQQGLVDVKKEPGVLTTVNREKSEHRSSSASLTSSTPSLSGDNGSINNNSNNNNNNNINNNGGTTRSVPTKIQTVSASDEWTPTEIAAFREGYSQYGKNFKVISQEFVRTKNEYQCKHFFSAKRNKCHFADIVPEAPTMYTGNNSSSSSNNNNNNSSSSSSSSSSRSGIGSPTFSAAHRGKEIRYWDQVFCDLIHLHGKNWKALGKSLGIDEDAAKLLYKEKRKYLQLNRATNAKHHNKTSTSESLSESSSAIKFTADGEPIPLDVEPFTDPQSPVLSPKKTSRKSHSRTNKQTQNNGSTLHAHSTDAHAKHQGQDQITVVSPVHLASSNQPQFLPQIQQQQLPSMQTLPQIQSVQHISQICQVQQQQQQQQQQLQQGQVQIKIQQPSILPASSSQLHQTQQIAHQLTMQTTTQVSHYQQQQQQQQQQPQPPTRGLVVQQYNPKESAATYAKKEHKQYSSTHEKKSSTHGSTAAAWSVMSQVQQYSTPTVVHPKPLQAACTGITTPVMTALTIPQPLAFQQQQQQPQPQPQQQQIISTATQLTPSCQQCASKPNGIEALIKAIEIVATNNDDPIQQKNSVQTQSQFTLASETSFRVGNQVQPVRLSAEQATVVGTQQLKILDKINPINLLLNTQNNGSSSGIIFSPTHSNTNSLPSLVPSLPLQSQQQQK